MDKYFVNASVLNLRSSPSSTGGDGNIITRLKNQEVIEVTDNSNPSWYKVNCVNRDPVISGYASGLYLKPVAQLPANSVDYLKPVHLSPNPASRRNNHAAWQFPLSELNQPVVDANAASTARIAAMHQVINYLQVDKSLRYQRDEHTYCNIYAYDYCYLNGVFLPRVWWRGKALLDLKAGTAVQPAYELTVDEINANGLLGWLEDWGPDYGWKRTYDLDELQTEVNKGKVGLICAANINPHRSGHICCVIPENFDHQASRDGGKVTCPLLSQAGAVNLQYYNNNKWWIRLADRFKQFGYWYQG